ncbi:MAG: rhodanese-like domain-containing protein [Anaerolineae bacterium]
MFAKSRLFIAVIGLMLIVAVVAGCASSAPAPSAPPQAPQAQQAAPAPQAAQPQQAAVPAPSKFDTNAAVTKYVSTLPDGFNGIAPAKAKEQMDAAKPLILDVREPQELKDNGYLAGAVNIPVRSLLKNLDKLPTDKAAPILVYCAVGHRGALALEALNLLGYTNVKSISGGFNAWKAANLPVETGTPQVAVAGKAADVDPAALAVMDKYISTLPDGFNGIAPAKAKEQMDAAKPFILDVREAKELQDNGKIAGAVNIPIRDLVKSLDKLPQDKAAPILVYCAIGHRGALALEALNLLGYTNVKSISGGFNGWKAANLPTVAAS